MKKELKNIIMFSILCGVNGTTFILALLFGIGQGFNGSLFVVLAMSIFWLTITIINLVNNVSKL